MCILYNFVYFNTQTTYIIPEVSMQLFSKNSSKCCHDNKVRPHPLTPLSGTKSSDVTGRGQRKPAHGVNYLSPTKPSGCDQGGAESCDHHVIQIKGSESVDGRCGEKASHLRSALFYGTQQRHKTRKRALSNGGYTSQATRERDSERERERDSEKGREGERERGVRQLPTSVTQPVWVTKLEQWWGVMMVDEVSREGGGRGGGEVGRGRGEVGRGRGGGEVGRGGGEVERVGTPITVKKSQQVVDTYFAHSSNKADISNPNISDPWPMETKFDKFLGLM